MKKDHVAVDYTEEKYGPIADIMTSDLGKKYMNLDLIIFKLRERGLSKITYSDVKKFAIDQRKTMIEHGFLQDFVSNVKIADRKLDEGILNLAPIWYKIGLEEDLKEGDDEPYKSFFEPYFMYYIKNNGKTRVQRKDMGVFFVSRIQNERAKREYLGMVSMM